MFGLFVILLTDILLMLKIMKLFLILSEIEVEIYIFILLYFLSQGLQNNFISMHFLAKWLPLLTI